MLSPPAFSTYFTAEAGPLPAPAETSTTCAKAQNANKKMERPLKTSYQNVTLALSPSGISAAGHAILQLEEKDESQSKREDKPLRPESLILLSGGCVSNMEAGRQPVHVIHHHHHHHTHEWLETSSRPTSICYVNNNCCCKHIRGNTNKRAAGNFREVLEANEALLEASGWYHRNLSSAESAALLRNTEEGTFIIRDSADSRFLYSLSIQMGRSEGPRSARISFSCGKFWLDSHETIQHLMPKFDSVIDLIQHYLKPSSDVLFNSRSPSYSPIHLLRPLLSCTARHPSRLHAPCVADLTNQNQNIYCNNEHSFNPPDQVPGAETQNRPADMWWLRGSGRHSAVINENNNYSGNLDTSSYANVNVRNIKEVLDANEALLEASGWYHHKMGSAESAELLHNTSEGTFLIRDSADTRFLFSLSVQMGPLEGATSVRIHFSCGKFRLDADEKIQHLMPTFDSVVALIEHYLIPTSDVLINNSGHLYSPICLRRPLYTTLARPPKLSHIARIAINKNLANPEDIYNLGIPYRLRDFLSEYPHRI